MANTLPDSVAVAKINKTVLIIAIIDTFIVFVLAFAIGIHYSKVTEVSCTCSKPNESQGTVNQNITDPIVTDSSPVQFVTREQWMARPPVNESPLLELPSTRPACIHRMLQIQAYHMELRGFNDIGYNFVIGGDGNLYIGRGWNNEGEHTRFWNKKSIAIAFVGTYTTAVPTPRQLFTAQKILEEGIKLNKLSSDYRLYGHRQLKQTESPGLALYEIIKKWDHWTSEIL